MTDSADMQLVFRLAGRGFAVPIDDVVEIREAEAATAQVVAGEAGNVPELIDLLGRLGLPGDTDAAGALLVLCGSRGPWMMRVERVEGIFPARDFRRLPLPELLRRDIPLPYEALALWCREPLHACRALALEQFGGDA